MTIQKNIKKVLGITIIGFSSMASTQASAVSLSDIWNKVNQARTYAAQARNYGASINTEIKGNITNKLTDIQSKVDQIPAKLDALPDPAFVLGSSKEFIENNVIRITDDLQRVRADFQAFKGENCGAGTPCGNLRDRLLGIYRGLNSIKDKLPGFDVLPSPSAFMADPKELAIQNMPPMVLFGLNTLTGQLDGLDRMETIAQWVDGLRFYKLMPIEEDDAYRLPVAECNTLETSIKTDNAIFNETKDLIGKVEIVTYLMQEIMPKDITINAWVGTSIPNPALPVAVMMNKISADFDELLEMELSSRKQQVKGCRTQAFRTQMLSSIAN